MQSVKFVMREVGITDEYTERVSAEAFSEYVQYNYLSDGYKVLSAHADPVHVGQDFRGYRVFLTLVKEDVKAK